MLIGVVGKPSSGKTTFVNAACMTSYKTANYPFTTIEPQLGTAYVRVDCVCKELGVKDNPRNSICVDGIRYVPIKLLDVAGLVPDAWKGRGLGNKFLDDLRQADALIHVVDISGSLDADGREVGEGKWDPLEDIKFLEREINMWMYKIIDKDWRSLVTKAKSEKKDFAKLLEQKVSGLAISRYQISEAIRTANLDINEIWKWEYEEKLKFIDALRRISKPMLIAANKIDKDVAQKNYERIKNELEDKYYVVPCSALGEFVLRSLSKKALIKYNPGDSDFEVVNKDSIGPDVLDKLLMLKEKVLRKYGSTGVQEALETAVFKLLKMIAVFPVEDVNSYTDHQGNVLPDTFLVPEGTTTKELAFKIHTTLGESFIHAIDGRTKMRLSDDYKLKHRDIIKIVSAKGKK